MIEPNQAKVLEIAAASAVNAAALFFAILTLLFGMAQQSAPVDRRKLRPALCGTAAAVVISLVFIVLAFNALRFQTAGLYEMSVAAGSFVLALAALAAVVLAFAAW